MMATSITSVFNLISELSTLRQMLFGSNLWKWGFSAAELLPVVQCVHNVRHTDGARFHLKFIGDVIAN